MTPPRATYRLQMHRDFTFEHARAQVPYLARLGISHLYLSPILTARSGSMHGYDVVDHSAVNPELGGETAYRALVQTLREFGMGVIVDIVPNHMAVGGADNRLWLDVLEWGRASRYATFFDIDWDVPDPALKNRVLAPFLGRPYGEALQEGELQLQFDADAGRFFVGYFEHRFPIAPTIYAALLRLGGDNLSAHLPPFRAAMKQALAHRGEQFAAACAELAAGYRDDSGIRAAIDTLLAQFDTRDDGGVHRLHRLLERQHYRLACWRTAADEINWRRFFDVIQLAGIRIQHPAAFEIVHATTLRLYAEGLIDGVRIDHIDGLSDPRTYCRRLRTRLRQLAPQRPATAPAGPAYFVVEKILAPEEHLPRDWQIDGTTGYSFMNDVSALLHDPDGESALTELWTRLSGRSGDFEAESKRARRRILHELLAAEFNACARALHRLARGNPLTRDWSLLAVRRVLEELLVQFPIYRTYADGRGRSADDDAVMRNAIAAARPHCRGADAPLLELIDGWLGAESPHAATSTRERQARLLAITRFQQLSSPLAAKSVEDTAFYRHGRLLSRNEVGANPAVFANSPTDFHAECERRAAHFPNALLATATHDHKRGEDLRARLAVLSEIPASWAEHVQGWIAANAGHKTSGWPEPADEYMLYQMLTGGWPLDLRADDREGLAQLRDRLQQWWLKALREAKNQSSWSTPNLDYETACEKFLHALLDREQSSVFIDGIATFAQSIAAYGAVNGLSQTVLKLTTPGIPDIYQGCEWWDFSFVDPDNRRPVDYERRATLLAATNAVSTDNWQSGAIKQQVIARLLALRGQCPELFARGDYRPLISTGPQAHHVFAFTREWQKQKILVAILRLPATLNAAPLPSTETWRETSVPLPQIANDQRWRTLLTTAPTGAEHTQPELIVHSKSHVACADLFVQAPFAVLIAE